MRCFKLCQTVEVRAHLFEVRCEEALVRGISIVLLGAVSVISNFMVGVFEDLGLESRFNNSEKLVLLLLNSFALLALGGGSRLRGLLSLVLKFGDGRHGLLALTEFVYLGLLGG